MVPREFIGYIGGFSAVMALWWGALTSIFWPDAGWWVAGGSFVFLVIFMVCLVHRPEKERDHDE